MVDGVQRDDGLKNVNQILVFVYLFVAVVIFIVVDVVFLIDSI